MCVYSVLSTQADSVVCVCACVYFRLLSTRGVDFPTAGGSMQKKKICNSGLAMAEISSPVTVREAQWLAAAQRIVVTEDKAEVVVSEF
jgi:hypothetical protein